VFTRAIQVRDGRAAYYVRAASLAAGFPNTSAATSANRFCASGLTAIQHVANEIKTGTIEIGIAVGAESLSEGNERLSRPFVDEIINANDDARDCMLPMGKKAACPLTVRKREADILRSDVGATSENVARDFSVSRHRQDEYAVESYRRAELAQKSGWYDDEIVPIAVRKDGKDTTITRDEIRWGTTYEGVSKLRPAFPDYGDTTHAGNSSQVTDGEYPPKESDAQSLITLS
jgi:acetyl-CoA acyltransferase 1